MGSPLFGKGKRAVDEKEEPVSIRHVPRWEEAAGFLGDRLGVSYETAVLPGLLPGFPRHQVEVARDKESFTMLLPGSEAGRADMHHLEFGWLGEMDAGATTEEVAGVPLGTLVVGRRTVVRRQFLDAFVECASRIYQIPWNQVRTLTYKREPFPMLLLAAELAFCIAPINLEGQWKREKYHPEPVV